MDLSELLQRLPEELIMQSIFPLMDSTSRARAAAVCHLWRNYSRGAPPPTRDADRCIPWILVTNKELHHSLLEPSSSSSSAIPHRLSSYRLKLKKNYKYKRHQENGKFIVATHRQYLMHNRQHSHTGVIHDPFTGEKIKLSPAHCCWPLAHFSYLQNLPEPNLAAVMEDCYAHTLIHRSWMDDIKWKLAFYEGYVTDLIFHKDQLFRVTKDRGIKAMHISTPNLRSDWKDTKSALDHVSKIVPEMAGKDTKYPKANIEYLLVNSCNGSKLWFVTKYDLGDRMIKFEVHQVMQGELVEVNNLGEAMLFVKNGSSQSCWSTLRTLSAPASSDEFFTKNSVYFFHTEMGADEKFNFSLGKFTLGDDLATFHPCPLYSECCPYWINPVVKF